MLTQTLHAVLDHLHAHAHLVGHGLLAFQVVGYELVERRVEQTDVHRHAVHAFQDAIEVLLLIGQQLGEGFLAAFLAVGEDHLTHGLDLLVLEEHVLGTAQADTHGTEVAGHLSVVRRVGIGADDEACVFVAKLHQFGEVACDLCGTCLHLAEVYLARRTVERDVVALVKYGAVDLYGACLIVDIDGTGTTDAALAHTAGYHSSVGCHTAASREDTLSGAHAGEVFWRSLDAHHHHLMAVGVPFLSVIGEEHDLAAGSTRRCGQSACEHTGLSLGLLVEDRMEQFVELVGLAALQGCLLVDESLPQQIHGDLHHCRTRALAVTGLEEPELALLHGELHVLHVVVVLLKFVLQVVELCEDVWHRLLHGRIFAGACCLVDALLLSPAERTFLGDLLWRADTGDNVLTLCVDKILAVEAVLACGSVTAEADTRSGGVAHVAEDHGHDGNCRTPFLWDALHLAVEDGAVIHPRVEDSADGAPELLHRVGGELAPGALLDIVLEEDDEALQLVGVHLIVETDAALRLYFLNDSLERIDVFFVDRLHAEDHVAVHLYEAAVAVIGKALVARLGSQALDDLIVETKVEDGVHHTRHGGTGTGANADKKRILGIAELQSHELLDVFHAFNNVVLEQSDNVGLALLKIFVANISGDRESRWHGHADQIHLGQVGTFAAKEVAHVGTALSLTVSKEINSLLARFFTHS